MTTPPFDLAQAHRWFAVECNNEAWELVEKDGRSADETERMIQLAHAAALHWKAAGNSLNDQRADCLLATAYLKAGRAEPALRFARRGLQLSEQNTVEETPFDRATALACAAKAHALAGDANEAERLMALANAIAGKLEAEDRDVFRKLYC